ncbi:DUF5123 domain-containing protein [Parapedobacter tibetensis]|uniref:DUF5123 domain-containing protein n=1 Tax=Parapedobacter tibetensis TaxID=2972951 RepID=UPI00214DDAD0|nr:DUF5123 domain-containing protein [Parapedobacter tibetensis]
MKKIIFKLALFVVGIAAITSCEKKINDWEVDLSYQRLFRPLVFDVSHVAATEVEIRYTQIVSADKYIFEFSTDDHEFSEIVKAVEILADTLTPFAPSTSPARVEYRIVFDELDGSANYAARMKGINTKTGEESKYVEIHFQTTAEQLFTSWETYIDRIVMHWSPSDRVTHISVFDTLSNLELKRIDLTESDKTNGSIEITDLEPGTYYRAAIYNDDVERGSRILRTSGLDGGEIIPISPGDDIPTLVSAAIAAGEPNVILMFSGNQTYDLGALTLPLGVSNVSVTGEPDANGNKPKLNLSSFRFADIVYGEVIFENVDIHAVSGSAFLITQDQNGAEAAGYSFANCYIEGFGNGVVRLNNSVSVRHVTFDNCMVNRNGGWGVVNIGGSTASVDLVSFTNSTLTDLATQLMDVRVSVASIVIENCTFYNQNLGMSQLLRFDTNRLPLALTINNNIIAGTNSGASINATSYDHANFGLGVSFAGSYRTAELQIERASRDFANITIFDGTTADLFVNPEQRNFSIKAGNGFGGRGTAGDPRWFD